MSCLRIPLALIRSVAGAVAEFFRDEADPPDRARIGERYREEQSRSHPELWRRRSVR